MMSRHFRLSSELSGAIAKRLSHPKNQLSAPGSFFNQFVKDIYICTYSRLRLIGSHQSEDIFPRLSGEPHYVIENILY